METVDIVLASVYLVMAVAVGVLLFSAVYRIRMGEKSPSVVNGIPAGKITLATVIGTIVMLVITFLTGTDNKLTVNGDIYENTLWLKVADMFIFTSLMMFVLAAVIVLYGVVRRYVNIKRRRL